MDAIKSSSSPHCFLSVTKQGLSAIVETEGNDACHVILRGANSGPNYSPAHMATTSDKLRAAKLAERIMIDCSHGNSEKKHENQMKVVDSVKEQLSDKTTKSWAIIGVMLESNLVEGKQSIPASGPSTLTYGQVSSSAASCTLADSLTPHSP